MINDISVKNNDVKPNRNVIKKNEYRKNEQPSKVQKFMDLYFKTKKRVNTVVSLNETILSALTK